MSSSRSTHSNLTTHLIFDGIDTFANVSVCGRKVASVNNQFRQWKFDITAALSECTSDPMLEVAFTSAVAGAAAAAADPDLKCVVCSGTNFEFPNRLYMRKEQVSLPLLKTGCSDADLEPVRLWLG